VLYRFRGGRDGEFPAATLLRASDGRLFGTTAAGGSGACNTIGCGTAFVLKHEHGGYSESVLHAFRGGSDGSVPSALVVGGDGALYGTSNAGGNALCATPFSTGCGTVFDIRRAGGAYAESVLYRFEGGKDGANPLASLLVGMDGALFGTTVSGGGAGCGGAGCGTVFEIATSGASLKVVYRFRGGRDGSLPAAPLTADSRALYGSTVAGGGADCSGAGCGTVFALSLSGGGAAERVLHRFDGREDGSSPVAGVASDGTALVGTTASGGGSTSCRGGCGTVFRVAIPARR
jgi:uncharacterized repeat protein (TIGR03803 family)